MTLGKWDPCVSHRSDKIDDFIDIHFMRPDRRILFIGGAGFDPRSTLVAAKLSSTQVKIRGLFIKEERQGASLTLIEKASKNQEVLSNAISDFQIAKVEIFGSDNAVVGSRHALEEISKADLDGITDAIVDISALSIGTAFPITRYLIGCAAENSFNLHVFVSHNPDIDKSIISNSHDVPSYVHGFIGEATLDGSREATKLWLPQLAMSNKQALKRLHTFVDPDDTCPILPFPAADPREGDVLAELYIDEFEKSWLVDSRNVVYADESDPLDLYRTILRLHDFRKPVFAEVGKSLLILSPLGSKVLALGAMMAAIERDLPVAYLEAVSYELVGTDADWGQSEMLHIWLAGEVYSQDRSGLVAGEGAT